MPRRASDTTREENISHTRRTSTVRVCLWRTHGSYVLNMRFDQAVRGALRDTARRQRPKKLVPLLLCIHGEGLLAELIKLLESVVETELLSAFPVSTSLAEARDSGQPKVMPLVEGL